MAGPPGGPAVPGGNVVKPKHAKARPSRVIVPVVVAVLMLGGGSVAAYQVWPDAGVLGAGPLEVSPSGSSTPTAAVPSSPSSTPPPSTRSTPTPSADVEAEAALTGCQAKVRAADRVIDEARTGIGHWNEHVQAQTDAYAGKVDADQLARIFTRTRLLGPADRTRYNTAVTGYDQLDGTCATVPGATAVVTDQLGDCRERAADQRPVLGAATDAMTDWTDHQRDMARSRHQEVLDAQQIWIDTWRAAPPHLAAWNSAVEAYEPPTC